jgi:hypothetical protein
MMLVFWPKKSTTAFNPVIRLAFLIGGISSILAGISGLLQYRFEGFAWDSIQNHLIAGTLTTLGSFYLCSQIKDSTPFNSKIKIQTAILFMILTVTGHLGGNISRGDTYLIEVLPAEIQVWTGQKILPEKPLEIPEQGWEELAFYDDVIQPILNQNCKSCHNPKNLKGALNLTSFEALRKGGENGAVIQAGNLQLSTLYAHMTLPLDHEDHMPPKDKRQPEKEEIELIRAWITSGAAQNTTLAQARIDKKLVEPFFHKEELPFYPLTEVPMPSLDTLAKLQKAGFFAEQVHQGSSWLKISCINLPGFEDKDWKTLASFKRQIAYLDLSGTQVTEQILNSIAELPHLTVLKLNQTAIEGTQLQALQACKNLKLLYLNATGVGLEKLSTLDQHPSLEKVFAFQTPAGESPSKMKFSFELETGNYSLPKIPTDTLVY